MHAPQMAGSEDVGAQHGVKKESRALSQALLRRKYVWIKAEEEERCSRCGSKFHDQVKCGERKKCGRCSNADWNSRCHVVVQRTQIMKSFRDQNEFQEMREVYASIGQDGHKPSVECYTVYMSGLAADGRMEEAEAVVGEMEENGVCPDAICYNSLINAWCNAGKMEEAIRVFKLMKHKECLPSTSTYNTLIKGFGLAGQPDKAMDMLHEMSMNEGTKPNTRTYNMLIKVWCKQKKLEEAKKVMRMMRAAGFSPVEEGKKVIRMMRAAGLPPDVVSYNTLAKLYGELGKPVEAERVIKEMLNAYIRPNERTYAMVVTSFCQAGMLDRAFGLVERMRIQGVPPNLPIFNILLKAYAGLFDPCALDKVFKLMESHGVHPDVSSFGMIMDVWCTAGLVDDARCMLLHKMKEYDVQPDVVAYAILAKGYARYGRASEAESVLEEMLGHDLKPNVVTYTTVIGGWCSLAKMDDAMRVFEQMQSAGVAANLTTYHTLIWGFNEAKLPHRAEAVLELVKDAGLLPDSKCFHLVADAWRSVGSSSDARRILGTTAPTIPDQEEHDDPCVDSSGEVPSASHLTFSNHITSSSLVPACSWTQSLQASPTHSRLNNRFDSTSFSNCHLRRRFNIFMWPNVKWHHLHPANSYTNSCGFRGPHCVPPRHNAPKICFGFNISAVNQCII